ncbi:MAG: threonine ammonia-lyase [Hyphomicrobiaceae bacterium]
MPTTPTIADIHAAATRIAPHAVRTPLITNARLDDKLGARVRLKAENMQRVGAFKFRGAFNAVSQVPADEASAGILTTSSGNHAQGIAEAARLCGVPATIVMPTDAPDIKVAGVKRSGGAIVTYDRATEDREGVAEKLLAERGGVFIHPYDNPHIIAGQGTAGVEITEDMEAQGDGIDTVLVPCGGGGLLAGTCLAIHDRFPEAKIYAVEPHGFDDTARSLASGQRETNPVTAGSICDALLSRSPGELTFRINKAHLADVLVVTDDEARAAVRFAWEALKTVVEPGGAVALAALLSGKIDVTGQTVVAILSGGNIDAQLFAEIITDDRTARQSAAA